MNKITKMKKIDFNKIEYAIKQSSEEAKNLLFSEEVGADVFNIAHKNNLDEEQYVNMVDEIGYVILGLKPQSLFPESLLDIIPNKTISLLISNEIKKKIFSKLEIKSEILKITPLEKDERINEILKSLNEEDERIIPNYVKSLGKEIIEIIFDKNLKNKILDISKKYSLSENQNQKLLIDVLSVIIKFDSKDNLIDLMVKDVSVSRLLAEQIMNDLDSRVFDYAIKTIGINQEAGGEKAQAEPMEESSLSKEVSNILKEETNIEPEKDMGGLDRLRSMSSDLKNIEEDKTRKEKEESSVPTNLPGAMVLEEKEVKDAPRENEAKEVSSTKTEKEFVQRPISVPRYIADLGDKDKGEYLLKKSGIYPEHNDEQNRPTDLKPDLSYKKESPADFPEKSKTEDGALEKPTHSYTVDPYREPLN